MVADVCIWCEEPILPEDKRAPDAMHAHLECGLRMIVGGVNHLLRQCSCCGGTQPPDPPGMAKRRAALIASTVFGLTNP